MSENLKIWNALRTPPQEALKKIQAGRLKGMTDISPQWRYEAMTQQFGPIGFGWNYTITDTWTELGSDNQICAFAKVEIKYKQDGEWSEPIPGIGGSMLVAKESKGPHTSDECFKMAVTDAISVAAKTIGVAADIYMGEAFKTIRPPSTVGIEMITEDQLYQLEQTIKDTAADQKGFCAYFRITSIDELPSKQYETAIAMLNKKRG